LNDLIKTALDAGAADAMIAYSTSVGKSSSVRFGNVETKESGESSDISITIFAGSAADGFSVGSRDISLPLSRLDDIKEAVLLTVDDAKTAPVLRFAGILERKHIPAEYLRVKTKAGKGVLTWDQLTELALVAEKPALKSMGSKTKNHITNVDSAGAEQSFYNLYMLGSNGFKGTYSRTTTGVSVALIAEKGDQKQIDGEYKSAASLSVKDAQKIGRTAVKNTRSKLDPKLAMEGQFPIVFDRPVAVNLISAFTGAINGGAVIRNSTFLKDKMDQQVFSESVTIIADPLLKNGVNSRPFTEEGVPSKTTTLVENGVLKSWILGLRSARELELEPTGHGGNLYMKPGALSRKELIATVQDGFFVRETMGHGVNAVTGDFSLAASGSWIKNGKLSHAVESATISGNMKDMFMNITPANDINLAKPDKATMIPTLRIDGMTIR
jgi:PmbA protein